MPLPRLPVLLLTRNFPPLRGGMERLIHALARELAQQAALSMVGPAGCARFADGLSAVREVPLRPLWRFYAASAVAAAGLVRRDPPRVIVCGSGLMAPLGWLLARLTGSRVICYLHGLDLVVSHPAYQRLFVPLIRRCDQLVVNSRYTATLAVAAGVPPARIAVLHPGVDLAPLPPAEQIAAFRMRHRMEGPVILCVGRLTRRKGLVEFIRNSLPGVVRACPRACLVIVGEPARAALTDSGQDIEGQIDAAVREHGLVDHVRRLGDLPDDQLALAYASSQVLAFPVLALPGDVEGFGMVALEAAAHGLPTVAFATGGVPDAVDPQRSGCLLAPGDYAAMTAALLRFLDGKGAPVSAESCRAFASAFSWSSRGIQLHRLCRVVVAQESAARS